ncbi:MAG: hypothetical protein L6Q71_05670, partial [Planctomycetes bacterium]|nr:hypothetical protein [Planctomycetota bacterium]
MRKSWWYLSLIIGLTVSAALVWRVASQRHQIEKTKLEKRIEKLDEDIKLGVFNADRPLAREYYAMADDLEGRLKREDGIR